MRLLLLSVLCLFALSLFSQPFSQSDSIRGGLTPERTWWDLNYYHLTVDVDVAEQSISGTNEIRFTALKPGRRLQIDLQQPMRLTAAKWGKQELEISHAGNAHYVNLSNEMKAGEQSSITVSFSGKPRIAQNPPWDGGLVWTQDPAGQPWIANANQGIGASVWWPVKDHPADEVDSMRISVITPPGLMDVSNGQLENFQLLPDRRQQYTWKVVNPINDYGVNLSIGDYVFWNETYAGENGPLNMSYYVLRHNKAKAIQHFKEARKMMEAFEHWFGPYPFYEDGFKLVEVPYLGMEHQSAVTYGNKYKQGYLGRDLSGTGEGLKFDFIIVHESGHEWFANNITNADVADMWIHEGFTAYSENLFLDYHFGTASAATYVIGTRRNIRNDRPIQSPHRGVAHEGSGDMYYKGANLLHTLRQVVNDDEQWRTILRGLNKEFRHQTVSSQQIFDYIGARTATDHFAPQPFFQQYVQTVDVPVFNYRLNKGKLTFNWENVVDGFKMPVEIIVEGQKMRLNVGQEPQTIKLKKSVKSIELVPDYYVQLP